MLCFVIGRNMIVDSFFLCGGRVFIFDMHAKRYLFILKASYNLRLLTINVHVGVKAFIPNTAVFGPTKLIRTTIASTIPG